MTTAELLQIDIHSLKKAQFLALKQEVIDTLTNFINMFEMDKFEDVQAKLKYSPAGDGYGSENYYISILDQDLYEVCDKLKSLIKN